MAARKPTAKKTAPQKTSKRNGAGASVETYFAQQPADKRALLTKLRGLVEKGAPDAVPSINFFAPPSVLLDPAKQLEGNGKTSRLLKVRSASDIDTASIGRWLKAAVTANS